MDDFTNLAFALNWVATIGGPYLVGKLLAYLAENWPAWHNFPTPVKFLAPMILSVLLAVGAKLLLGQAEFLAEIAPIYTTVAMAISAYLGSQTGYMQTRLADYGRKAQDPTLHRPYSD